MRKIAINKKQESRSCLSIESFEIDIGDLTTLEESLTEDTDTFSEIEQVSQETHSLFVRIAALEDIAQVLDEQIKEATPAEAILVDIASDLAVEGTDVEDQDITPGLESALGARISSEGIKETASRFLSAIADKISNGLDHMVAWFKSIPAMLRIAKRQIKELANASANIDDSVQGSFKLGSKLKGFCVGGKIPTTQKDVIAAVNSIKADIVQLYGPSLNEIENMLKAAFEIKLDLASGDEAIKQLMAVYTNAANHFSKMKTKGKLDSSILLKKSRSGNLLCDFGNTGIVSTWPQIVTDIKNNETPDYVNRAMWDGHGFSYVFNTRGYDSSGFESNSSTRAQVINQELPLATKAELKQMLDSTLVIVDLLEKTLSRLEKIYKFKATFNALIQDDNFKSNTSLRLARVGRMTLHFNTANVLYYSARECLWLATAVFKLAAKSISSSGSKAPVVENIEA